MEVKELRIGNLIEMYIESSPDIFDIHTVETTSLMMINGDIRSLVMKFRPIVLTEEWLLNFGYKHVNTLNDGTKSFEGRPYCYFLNGEITISTATYHKIKYVHQFQNLIFALTGEELTIK